MIQQRMSVSQGTVAGRCSLLQSGPLAERAGSSSDSDAGTRNWIRYQKPSVSRVVVLRVSLPCEEPGHGRRLDAQSILPVSGTPSSVDRGKNGSKTRHQTTPDDTGKSSKAGKQRKTATIRLEKGKPGP